MSSAALMLLRSVVAATIVHELVRLSTLPLIIPSITSGFHSSFYLGLGWGAAETTWGIVRGWQMLAPYEPAQRAREDAETGVKVALGLEQEATQDTETGYENESAFIRREVQLEELEEAEIEDKMMALEKARERRGEL